MPVLLEPLTERELEILRLLAGHLTNGEIAQEIYLSVNTVKFHVRVDLLEARGGKPQPGGRSGRALRLID